MTPDRGTDDTVPYQTEAVGVLVIGAGAAGARAAIELVQRGVDPADVLVVGKRGHGDAHTTWARGGVNGAVGTHDPEDGPAVHAADTLTEGHFLNDPAKVETVAWEMPGHLRELDDWGMPFSRTDDGEIDQRYFGAQSFRRTAFAGDHTGESLLDTLVARAQTLSVPYRENLLVTKLVTDDDRVYGAVAVDLDDGGVDGNGGGVTLLTASQVVLAAGGYAALYDRHTSRDDENTGDGPALALDAGAAVTDTEFVQFHPTGMAVDESDPAWEPWRGRLVTEAVRGEGGRLYDADGERFMENYSPDQMELDARDVVARAIAQEVREGRGTENGGVYLDISHRDGDFVRERLPRMYERFQGLGVDMTSEPVEVAPTAHYGMGGVVVDDYGETEIDGLFAIGETMAGVHGANRLGGNSLAETLVFGAVAGERIAGRDPAPGAVPDRLVERVVEPHVAGLAALADNDGRDEPSDVLSDLRGLLWDNAGILRDGDRLQAGLDGLATLRERADDLAVGPLGSESFAAAVSLGFALTVAETVLRGAFARTASRGAHHRTDHPETDPDWRRHVEFHAADVGLVRSDGAVGEPSDAVQAALDAGYELDYHQLE